MFSRRAAHAAGPLAVVITGALLLGCGADATAPTISSLPQDPAAPAVPTPYGSLGRADRDAAQAAGALPLFVAGDLDGNGALDERDLEALARVLADPTSTAALPCGALGDLDRDGELTHSDYDRLERLVAFAQTSGRMPVIAQTKLGACRAVLPFTSAVTARPGETIQVRSVTRDRALTVQDDPNPGSVRVRVGSGPARVVTSSAREASIEVLAEAASMWGGHGDEPDSQDEREGHAVVVEFTVDGKSFELPIRIGPTVAAPTTENPEGYEKDRTVHGEDLYASGERSERAPLASSSCAHASARGVSFVVNLLANWKFDDEDAQAEQDDQLMQMHRALRRPEIENDFLHYEGYNDARMYPRPSRLVVVQPDDSTLAPKTVSSDTLAVGDATTLEIEADAGSTAPHVTVPGRVTSESIALATFTSDLVQWRADQDASKASVDALFADFEAKLAEGRSWAFFYVGSHGSPPDPGILPASEQYGYWSTGLGWRIWWNRAELLERARAKASAGGTCAFTAFDDSCYSGYTARFGRERAAACPLRPSLSGGAETTTRWLGVANESRSAMLDECIARENELVVAIDRAVTDGAPKGWLSRLIPDNFGQAYVDRGQAAPECH